MSVRPGLSARLERTVAETDTAASVGSGTLPVLGTPVLVAWCEAATCAALHPEIGEAQTSVGTRVQVDHQAPSVVGATLEVSASVVHVDGRLVRLSVAARDSGKLVASGEVTRVVVQTERFLSRLP